MRLKLETLDKILPFVGKPGRYIGGEQNIVVKGEDVPVKMVISYPDIYEVGMSNMAIQIIYKIVNDLPEFSCERVFAPWKDFEYYLRNKDIPLYSLETFTPLCDFDIVGFSVGYELLFTNLINILDLGKIPLFTRERTEEDPIVIAGGPGIYNPEPIADYIDVFVVGDGETALIEILNTYKRLKGKKRKEILSSLNEFEYTYVPSMYSVSKKGSWLITDTRKRVRRKIEPDIERLAYPIKPVVPIIKTVQDRVTVEVTRGCTTGCRFCQAGYIYRPVRERSRVGVRDLVIASVKTTGYEEVSLSALSISDYSDIYNLVKSLSDCLSDHMISISLPSLKVNSTNIEILEMIQRVRKSGLTFAVESPDENVRKIINKAVDDEQLLSIISKVYEMGWKLIKLYFMIGLPMAEEEGVKIANMIDRIKSLNPGISINVNVSSFVPKPHTPFERVKQIKPEKSYEILNYLKDRFKKTRVKIKYQNPEMSMIEGVLSRGDRRVSELIYNVFKLGERFSSWDEVFDFSKWVKAAEGVGINLNEYLKEKDWNEYLPWEIIDTGVSRKFLEKEFRKAVKAETTENCIYDGCPACGVCKGDIQNRLASKGDAGKIDRDVDSHEEDPSDKPLKPGRYAHSMEVSGKPFNSKSFSKYLFRFNKTGRYRYFSHLDLVNLFARAGRIAEVPFKYTEGFNPKPRIIIPFPLPLGVESEYELMEIFLLDQMEDIEEIITRYNRALPDGIQIVEARLCRTKKSIASRNYCHDYLIESGDVELIIANLNRDMIKKADLSKMTTLVGFNFDSEVVYLRLFGNMSLKRVFDIDKVPEILCSSKRVKIWEVINDKILDFM